MSEQSAGRSTSRCASRAACPSSGATAHGALMRPQGSTSVPALLVPFRLPNIARRDVVQRFGHALRRNLLDRSLGPDIDQVLGSDAVPAAVLTARLNSAQPIAGIMYELDAIAATVIGGTSLLGGSGTLSGTLIGALIMGVLRNGLNLLGISSFLQQVIIGLVIIGAVLVDSLLKSPDRR